MRVIYIVKAEVNPENEKAWDDWHTQQHIPDVLAAHRGFIRAHKYKIDTPEGGWSQYLVMYEMDSRESLDEYLNGEEVARLRAAHYAHFGNCTRLSRMILTATATIDKPIA